jgi:hypothetical protein
MTRASYQRIAARAAKHEFRMPPPGMLSEQIDLSDPFGLVLGLIHPEGLPMLVVAWDGENFRRLLPDQASTWADELVAAGQAVPLAPVIEAIRKQVKRVGEIVSAAIMREATVH